MTRLRGLLTVLVMVLMVGASSQAAVCELACEAHAEGLDCQSTAKMAAPMEMQDGHCSHGMQMMQQSDHAAVAGSDMGCSQDSMPAFLKDGSTASAHMAAVQWVVVGVVPFELKASGMGVGALGGPPLLLSGGNSLLTSLRV